MRTPKAICLGTFTRPCTIVEALFDVRLRKAGYEVDVTDADIHHECMLDQGHKGVHVARCGCGDWPPLDAYTPLDGEAQHIQRDERASIEAGHWDRDAMPGENLAT